MTARMRTKYFMNFTDEYRKNYNIKSLHLTKDKTGDNVKRGKDDTLYAMKAGVVKFSRRKRTKYHGNLAWERVVNVVDKN